MTAIAPMRPRRLTVVSLLILIGAIVGIGILVAPLPRAPALDLLATEPALAVELADRYAATLLASDRVRAFDPSGHAELVAARAKVRSDEASATTAFELLDAARRHADATVFPRWTAIFAFVLCFAGGVMGLWRARRAALADPGPSISYESAGLAVAATLVTTLLVGWTAVIVSTLVTAFTAGALGALIISGRVIPKALARPTTRKVRAWRIAGGLALTGAGIGGRRFLAPPDDAGGAEIVLRALPSLVATCVLILGMILAASTIAVILLGTTDPEPSPAESLRSRTPTRGGG